MISITDVAGGIKSFVYDQMDRVIKRTDENGNDTMYAYDAVGNLISVTGADGSVVKVWPLSLPQCYNDPWYWRDSSRYHEVMEVNMADLLADLYKIVDERRQVREQGSYTAYLFDAGIDKILKKLGEETTETIIAAKNLGAACEEPGAPAAKEMKEELVGEIGDLLYHLIVMCCEMGVAPEDIEKLLRGRMQKKGNLKESRLTDRNT